MSRTLDIAIAEHILGITGIIQVNDYVWMNNSIKEGLPSYSSHLLDAWQVVQHLRKQGWQFSLTETNEMGYGIPVLKENVWCACFHTQDRSRVVYEYHEDESMAICLAALETVLAS